MFGSASVVDRVLACEPTLGIQLLETVLIASAFGLLIPASTQHFARRFKTKSWYGQMASIMRDQLEKMMDIAVGEALLDKAIGSLPSVMGQHMLGGFMCLPALFGLGVPRDVALAMARHGALIELGWEIQDTVERLHERFFTEQGPAMQPNGLFFFLLMHHVMQWALVIPMNLYYSELPGYHELIFMLEGAAAVAGSIGIYGYTLDATKRSELLQMVVLNAIGFVIMVYTRFVHYWWSVFKCLSHFYAQGSYVVLAVGIGCGVFAMPFFSWSIVQQGWKKLVKFARMYRTPSDRDQQVSDLPTLLAKTQSGGDAALHGKAHLE